MAKSKRSRRRASQALPEELTALARIPVSGRYLGHMQVPQSGKYELELRIDIDRSHPHARVMDRVSGDRFEVFNSLSDDGSVFRVYRESWIVDDPSVEWRESEVEVTGSIRSWNDGSIERTISIRIPWASTSLGPASVQIEDDETAESYECEWHSNHFRKIELELDVCESVDFAPLLPTYNTHAHNNRPNDLPQRDLTIEEAFAEAGVSISIPRDRTVIDDSAEAFDSWTSAELHDAMVTHFSRISEQQQWKMWGLMAGKFEDARIGGIMFDAAADFGGAGVAPDRQGFAVFREHSWFKNLEEGASTTQKQAEAARKFLYTWVHEFGHGCNFLHAWDKSRPDALSWMNYDWKYDDRNGEGKFWKRFEFTFDDDELRHLRHGARAAVIMGGDAWSSGGHLRSHPSEMASLEIAGGKPPLELLVRSVGRFEFLEPIEIELRLRNLLKTVAVSVDGNMHPEFGNVSVFVKDPSGTVRNYQPLACKFAEPEMVTLEPAKKGEKGPDRLSHELSLSFGGHGFYFDRPGEYMVRAVYQGPNGMLIPSNVHRITIGFPASRDEERMAHDFFTPQVGLNLYFGGSQSPRLKDGMELLETLATHFGDRRTGARIASLVAGSIARPFYRVIKNKLKQSHEADPQQALSIANDARQMFEQSSSPDVNLPHRRLAEQRSACWRQMGEEQRAKDEITAMRESLAKRGVHTSVLNDILPQPTAGRKRKPTKKKTTSKKKRVSRSRKG